MRKAPANPLLSATTMTSGKRRLMDRVTRIAENRKNLGTALFAVAALAALVCAVTFTGAKAEEKIRPLTEAELAYFNGEFFTEPCGGGENRRRQFLACLYDRPQNIDLYELLYIGTGLPENFTEADRRYFEEYFAEPDFLERNHIKLSVTSIDTFLLENTGISFHDHRWEGLDSFWWNEEEDCYYKFHQLSVAASSYYDPRLHPEPVTFTSGTLEGDVVRLFYEGTLYAANGSYQTIQRGPLCATLKERPEGGWWFVSQDSAAPDWEPLYTIPLTGQEPYEPEVAEPLAFPYDYPEMLDGGEDPAGVLGDYALMFFRGGTKIFAGVQDKRMSSWPPPFWSFQPSADSEYKVSFFRNLMGHDGFCISAYYGAPRYNRINDYYYLNEDGQPVHLAQVEGYPDLIDLDGDGQKELVSQDYTNATLCFRRDGKYYQADLDTVLEPYWPEHTLFYYEGWDAVSREQPFRVWGNRYSNTRDDPQEHRMMYFDGENLLVYNDQRHFSDHMIEWYDERSEVKDAALEEVRLLFQEGLYDGASWDDWRITGLDGPQVLDLDGQKYLLWKVGYEVHGTTGDLPRCARPMGPAGQRGPRIAIPGLPGPRYL